MKRLGPWMAIGFFVLLACVEVAHGVARLESLRRARRQDVVDQASRALADLAAGIRGLATDGRRLAAFVARLPRAVELARGNEAAREGLARDTLALLASFPDLDRVRLLNADGRETFRCERMGGGVAAIPASLHAPEPDAAALELARGVEPGGVAVSGLFVDRERVEVPASERKVFHYVARPPASGFDGIVVLTVYASPILDRVRRFEPVAGARTSLVAPDGSYVAAADRAREVGGGAPSTLVRDHPAAQPVLHGVSRIETAAGTFLAEPLGDQPWRVVTELPESAFAAATQHLTRDHWRAIAVMVATLAVLAVAAIVVLRLANRALRVREAEAALHRLEQRAAMERKLATAERLGSLGLLTAGVAHEINNPLEGIGNYLKLLDAENLAPDKRRKYLDAVRHGFERIREVVRSLLGFARPVRGPGSADVPRVIARAVELARLSQPCRHVAFDVTGAERPIAVACDEGALEQVLLNLFLNAGHAMGGRGPVRVEAVPSGDGVEIRVEDEGPGIPPGDLDRIFDPFFTTGDSSGLGLSVSYGIARAHGGSLLAENLAPRGARFTLRLPVAAPAPAPAGMTER